MRLKLKKLAICVLLLICMAEAGLWLRSRYAEDSIIFTNQRGYASTSSLRDSLDVQYDWSAGVVSDKWSFDRDVEPPASFVPVPAAAMKGVGVSSEMHIWGIWYTRYSRGRGDIAIPYAWILALSAGITLIVWYSARLHRHGPARCSKCGYDLRATPDRCPECGTLRSAVEHSGGKGVDERHMS